MDREARAPGRSRGCCVAELYNAQRPHDALDGGVQLDRYQVSPRQYRDRVELNTPRTISSATTSSTASSPSLMAPCACAGLFAGERRLQATATDGVFDAWFRHQKIETIDLNTWLDSMQNCSRCPRPPVRDAPARGRRLCLFVKGGRKWRDRPAD